MSGLVEYALVSPQHVVLERRMLHSDDAGNMAAVAAHKNRYLPIVRQADPEFDPACEMLDEPLETVEQDRVLVARSVRQKTPEEIGAMRMAKAQAVSDGFRARTFAPIAHEAGGQVHLFDADETARARISAVVTLIAAGAAVPDPRPWTPANSLTPVSLTHGELIGLGLAIAAREDALFVVKKTLEAQLAGLTEPGAIAAFDPQAGWGE